MFFGRYSLMSHYLVDLALVVLSYIISSAISLFAQCRGCNTSFYDRINRMVYCCIFLCSISRPESLA